MGEKPEGKTIRANLDLIAETIAEEPTASPAWLAQMLDAEGLTEKSYMGMVSSDSHKDKVVTMLNDVMERFDPEKDPKEGFAKFIEILHNNDGLRSFCEELLEKYRKTLVDMEGSDGGHPEAIRNKLYPSQHSSDHPDSPHPHKAELPKITAHPDNKMNVSGTVAFRVHAQGTEPLTYHWETKPKGFDAWQIIPSKGDDGMEGGDSATMVIAGIKKSHEGTYKCTVINKAGCAYSDPAILTVGLRGYVGKVIISGIAILFLAAILHLAYRYGIISSDDFPALEDIINSGLGDWIKSFLSVLWK